MGNQFSGISLFGRAAFNNYIGSLQDGFTINGNVIVVNDSGIYIRHGNRNTIIFGNYIGTDLSGTVNLGNQFGGVDLIDGHDNFIGGPAPGEKNLIAYNSEGVFLTGLNPTDNRIRGNQYLNNLTLPFDIIMDGGILPDGTNPNDTDDDMGANL